jgi:hypothetical protein
VAAGNEFHVNNISKTSIEIILSCLPASTSEIRAYQLIDCQFLLCQLIGMPKISPSMISSIILSAGCERYRDDGIFQQANQ